MAIYMVNFENRQIDNSGLDDSKFECNILTLLNPRAMPEPIVEDYIQGIRDIDEACFDSSILLSEEQIRHAVMENRGGLWVAALAMPSVGDPFDTHNMMGYVMVEYGQNKTAYIEGLAVRAEARRHRVAEKLLDAVAWAGFLVDGMEMGTMTMRIENHPIRGLGEKHQAEFTQHLGSDFPDRQARDEFVIRKETWLESARQRRINLDTSYKRDLG